MWRVTKVVEGLVGRVADEKGRETSPYEALVQEVSNLTTQEM